MEHIAKIEETIKSDTAKNNLVMMIFVLANGIRSLFLLTTKISQRVTKKLIKVISAKKPKIILSIFYTPYFSGKRKPFPLPNSIYGIDFYSG